MFAVGVIALFGMTVGVIGSAWAMGGNVAMVVAIGVGISAYVIVRFLVNKTQA